MTWFGLVWSNLFRKRTRTILTLLSVAIAFLLLVLLRTVADAFSGGVSVAGADRLVVAPKYSVIDMLPIRQKNQVLGLDGVEAVAHLSWFGGQYQDPKNFFPKFPVVPEDYFRVFSELRVDPAAIEAFQRTRTGAMVAKSLMEKYGWSVGDVVPIEADIWPKADGSRDWQFTIVGVHQEAEGEPVDNSFLFHYDYFDEAVAPWGRGQYGWMFVQLSDPARAEEVARQVDAMFENSSNPTKTATAAEYQRQFAKQMGNISAAMTIIIGAVFFTIILLTANTMVQALRERIPELAVLKTLGFPDAVVAWTVLAEAVLLCLTGAAMGIGLALLLEPGLAPAIIQFTGVFSISASTLGLAVGVALALGLAVGAVPAWTAQRLAIVDALRER